jgi:pimeloyl-ACP methyl ester carboxylesterase
LDTNPTNIGHIDPRYLNVSVDSQAELVIWAFVQNSGVPDTVTINFAGQTRSFSPTDPGWVIWRIPVATADLLLPDKGSFPDPRLPLTPAVPPTPAANPLEITHTDTTGRGVKISNLQLSLPGMRPLVIASGFDIKSSNPHRPLYYADDDWDASLWGYLNPPATGTPNPLPYDQFSFYLPHDGRDSIVPTALPTSTGGGTTQGGGESMVPIIEGVKTMFGVQRVNILSHSMGGLWSREYVLNWDRKNSVDSLIMLGTPNGGSIIANAASIFYEFCVATSSLGGDCPKIIKRYEELSPAVSQLTTNYLEDYNNGRGKGPAPCVRYYDLAATNPAGGLAPDQFGINDEVVSVTSVETLPYSTHIPVITLPFVPLINGDVVHYHLPKDASVQATVEPYYNYKSNKSSDQCSSTASSSTHSPQGRGSTAPVSTTPTVEIRWPTVGDTISEGQTRTAMILVDSSNAATFALSWLNPTSTLSLSLIDPAGQVITPTSTYSGSSYSQIPDYFSGTTLMYMIAQPLVGTWQAVISAQTIYSDSESFYLGGNFVGGVQLDPAVSSKINTVGRPITLSTTLHDSAPISGAVVTASLILVTNGTAVSTVPLTEQPGGVYTGVFTPSVAGTYSVAIFAQGYNNQSEAFNRYSRLRFQASSGASLAGDFRDQAYDSTGTGLYDSLVISPTAAITQPGQYQMSGWLTTLDGRRLAYSTGVYTPTVGTVELPLSFPGRAIGAGGVDGPYQLRDLYFAQVISDELTVAAMPIAYTTTTYSRYAWVRAEVVQAGLATDRGLDMNNNGRYDYLEVTVPLDVRTTGTYNARLNLLAPDGNTITSADLPNLAFTQGTNAVTVRFSGPAIWASGKNGPYQVTDLLIWQSGQNPSTISSVLAQTTAYNSTDFEAPLPTPTATATVTLTPTRTPTITPTATATPAQDFILTVSPSNQTVTRPGSTTFTVQVNSVGGYSGTINLSVSGVPAKTTATFSPNPIVLTAGGTGTSTLTITTTNSTPQYVMNLTITGTDGIRSHTTTVAVIPQ